MTKEELFKRELWTLTKALEEAELVVVGKKATTLKAGTDWTGDRWFLLMRLVDALVEENIAIKKILKKLLKKSPHN